jgi:hypothetical protein
MTRKSFLLAIAIVLLLAGGTGTALVFLVRHEPAFYVRAAVPPGEYRTKRSGEFVSQFTNQLLGGILANKKQWEARFTEEQINSYFLEDFITKHSAENPLPEGISEPRFTLEPDHVHVGFRYSTSWWSTIVSLDLRVWLVTKEPNVVALEFRSLRAGALPIAAQSLLERVAEVAQQHDIDPTWYRHNGHPVLLLRFQADRTSPTFQLKQLEFRPGMLRIIGGSI